jgi:hypothetical protein
LAVHGRSDELDIFGNHRRTLKRYILVQENLQLDSRAGLKEPLGIGAQGEAGARRLLLVPW